MADAKGQTLIDDAEYQIMILAEGDQRRGGVFSRSEIEELHEVILNLEDDGRGQASTGYNALVGDYRAWATAQVAREYNRRCRCLQE